MKITAEEELMYKVMTAIYNSSVPVNFKGSMVLKAYLHEAGYLEETRHTVDIDANWYSDAPPTAKQMAESMQVAIQNSGLDLNVSLYRMYGEGRSAGLELSDSSTDEILFTMDVDVNRPMQETKLYEIAGVKFRGIVPSQMIADKLAVVSSDKVFRRIKDVVDLYYMSKVLDFNTQDILQSLENSGRILGEFDGFLNRTGELKHSYDKFRFNGDVNKPGFDEIYCRVKNYIEDILPPQA